MIRLTVKFPGEDSSVHEIQEDTIIGTKGNLALPIPDLQPQHVKIALEGTRCHVTNLAKDTSVTWDSQPIDDNTFDEQELQAGVSLKIGDVELLLEFVISGETTAEEEEEATFIDWDADHLPDLPANLDLDEELQKLDLLFDDKTDDDALEEAENLLENLDFDALFEEVSNLDFSEDADTSTGEEEAAEEEATTAQEQGEVALDFRDDDADEELLRDIQAQLQGHAETSADTTTPTPSEFREETQATTSLDEYEEDYETYEEVIEEKEATIEEKAEPLSGVGRFMTAAAIVFALTGILAVGTYWSVSGNNARYETLAARGVADAAMALTYAQLTHQHPDGDNWSDPEFLEENLSAVLSSKYRALSQVDGNGKLQTPSYRLRIRTDATGDRFLVAAQPINTMMQWLIPKSTLYVDSTTLQLRKTKDNEGLTKVFGLKSSWSPPEGQSFTAHIHNSKTISLSTLSEVGTLEGYAPPAELGQRNPGADAFVYNAPRYYKFAKAIIQTASSEGIAEGHKRDVAVLRQLVNLYSRFPALTVYSARGESIALAASKGLDEVTEAHPFQIGFVTFRAEDGLIAKSELLPTVLNDMHTPSDDIALPSTPTLAAAPEPVVESLQKQDTSEPIQQERTSPSSSVDTKNPLYQMLSSVASQRKHALKKSNDKIIALVQQHNEEGVPHFKRRHRKLVREYEEVQEQQRAIAEKRIKKVYQRFLTEQGYSPGDPPVIDTFMAYVKATSMDDFVPEDLQAVDMLTSPEAPETDGELVLTAIRNATDLASLDASVAEAARLLRPENIGDSSTLLTLESAVRTTVLNKVGEFLLSPSSRPDAEMFSAKNRAVLTRILNSAKVAEGEEKAFYLKEFDLLVDRLRSLPPSQPNDVASDTQQEEALSNNDIEREQLRERISQIPLNKITAADPKQKRNIGRLGQQILIRERALPPSASRDDSLLEAINLLSQATDDNRAFWEDILEARRLLTETPKQEIENDIHSALGFFHGEKPLFNQCKARFKDYIDATQTLNNSRGSVEHASRFEYFRDEQEKNLATIVEDTRTLQTVCRQLSQGLDTYADRLKVLLDDYNTAKTEGLFTTGARHHVATTVYIARKLKAIDELKPKLEKATQQIMAASQTYETLAEQQLHNLRSNTAPSQEVALTLQKKASTTSYPNLVPEKLGPQIDDLLTWNGPPLTTKRSS